ncbi:MAG: peptide deformylase [Gemmataceae bacterium]|nr:peptide deformylase [Gemmataceae bacterium]
MVLTIAQLGQPVLRKPAAEIPPDAIADPAFQRFLDDMAETLRAAGGVGLAGPQVFAGQRVFLAAILPPAAEGQPPGVEVFINPRLTALGEETAASWEGCLSFVELLVLVPRYRRVQVDYRDRHGVAQTLHLAGFPARVVQHENDHLDGVLTLDRAPSPRFIIKASEVEAFMKDMEAGKQAEPE